MDVADALATPEGTACLVGAGGKKTTMRTLAARTDPLVTATVRIPIFDRWVERVVVTDDPLGAAERLEERPLGLVPEREREDRYRGYDTSVVSRLASAVDDPLVVKADGARTRLLKAPADHEPQLPSRADTVVPVASVRAVGKPLSDEHVHRVDRVSALTGRSPGEELRPDDVATVLASDCGGLKGVPDGVTAVPLLNMVDDERLAATAREVARAVHDRADVTRVVLAEMRADDPVIDVV
ncbi:MAG: selenium cofactor biosynthesis protein YqeC [Haloarculaceae archaeon]